MMYSIKKERKTNKDIDFNNSSLQFKPLGSSPFIRVMDKCDSLAELSHAREE